MTSDYPLYDSSDEIFMTQTGKSLMQWISLLNEWKGVEKGHTKMIVHLEQRYNLDPKWAEAVAIRFQKEEIYNKTLN